MPKLTINLPEDEYKWMAAKAVLNYQDTETWITEFILKTVRAKVSFSKYQSEYYKKRRAEAKKNASQSEH